MRVAAGLSLLLLVSAIAIVFAGGEPVDPEQPPYPEGYELKGDPTLYQAGGDGKVYKSGYAGGDKPGYPKGYKPPGYPGGKPGYPGGGPRYGKYTKGDREYRPPSPVIKYKKAKGTAWDVISGSPDHTILTELIKKWGLVNYLKKDGLTIFAPVDHVLETIECVHIDNCEAIKAILYAHVVDKQIKKLQVRKKYKTKNGYISVKASDNPKDKKSLYFYSEQGQEFVVETGYIGKKFAVYVIDGLIIPKNVFLSIEQIIGALDLDKLGELVNAVDSSLIDVINDPDNQKTLFAPDDDAIKEALTALGLGYGLEGAPDKVKEYVKKVLLYHVVPGEILTVPWEDQTDVHTALTEASVSLTKPRFVVDAVDNEDADAAVVVKNLYFCGGVVQVIDKVLLPYPPEDYGNGGDGGGGDDGGDGGGDGGGGDDGGDGGGGDDGGDGGIDDGGEVLAAKPV